MTASDLAGDFPEVNSDESCLPALVLLVYVT